MFVQACVKQDVNRVKELLELGADPNTQDNLRWTPLVNISNSARTNLKEMLIFCC